MELHCEEDVFYFVENSVFSNDSETSSDFFDNLLQQSNLLLTESPTKINVSSLEADPLLSEAQLIDGQTLLDAFDIRILRPDFVPKLSPLSESLQSLLNTVSPSRSNISFDGSRGFAEETSSPKPKHFPIEIVDSSTDESLSVDSYKTNNNIVGLQSIEKREFCIATINDVHHYEKSNLKIKETPAILKSVDNQADANMNFLKINSADKQNIGKCDILLRDPPHMVRFNFMTFATLLNFKNAAGKQVLPTQYVELAEGEGLPKKLQIEEHKVLSVTQVQICKQLAYMLPQIQTNLGAKIYLCPLNCVKAFFHIADAKLHALKHMEIKPYKCDQPHCSWEFYTACKLARHRETHGKVKNFICERCNRAFSTIYNLNEHKRKHNRPATLKCPVEGCDAMFQNEKQRRTHCHKMHKHAEAPFRCNLNRCTKSFFTEALLEAHVRNCSLRESEVACSYPNCGKIFNTPYRLREHMRQHTGVKPYHCQYENCTWSFTTASKLKRHQSSHTRDRKFHCTIGDCKKSFLRSEHLKDHTLTHIEKSILEAEGKPGPSGHNRKNNPEKKVECTKVQPEEEDLAIPGTSADALLEQAIQSLGSDMMMGTGLVSDTEPMQLFEEDNFSTVNLRDLD